MAQIFLRNKAKDMVKKSTKWVAFVIIFMIVALTFGGAMISGFQHVVTYEMLGDIPAREVVYDLLNGTAASKLCSNDSGPGVWGAQAKNITEPGVDWLGNYPSVIEGTMTTYNDSFNKLAVVPDSYNYSEFVVLTLGIQLEDVYDLYDPIMNLQINDGGESEFKFQDIYQVYVYWIKPNPVNWELFIDDFMPSVSMYEYSDYSNERSMVYAHHFGEIHSVDVSFNPCEMVNSSWLSSDVNITNIFDSSLPADDGVQDALWWSGNENIDESSLTVGDLAYLRIVISTNWELVDPEGVDEVKMDSPLIYYINLNITDVIPTDTILFTRSEANELSGVVTGLILLGGAGVILMNTPAKNERISIKRSVTRPVSMYTVPEPEVVQQLAYDQIEREGFI